MTNSDDRAYHSCPTNEADRDTNSDDRRVDRIPEKRYCTYGPDTLYDLLAEADEIDVSDPPTCRYEGLFLTRTDNLIDVSPMGHVGELDQLDPDAYDDVLQLVADLNRLTVRWSQLVEKGPRERVEAAGKIRTSDAELADSSPDLYVHPTGTTGVDG